MSRAALVGDHWPHPVRGHATSPRDSCRSLVLRSPRGQLLLRGVLEPVQSATHTLLVNARAQTIMSA
eukprot:2140098-Rhodomonas_salina.2